MFIITDIVLCCYYSDQYWTSSQSSVVSNRVNDKLLLLTLYPSVPVSNRVNMSDLLLLLTLYLSVAVSMRVPKWHEHLTWKHGIHLPPCMLLFERPMIKFPITTSALSCQLSVSLMLSYLALRTLINAYYFFRVTNGHCLIYLFRFSINKWVFTFSPHSNQTLNMKAESNKLQEWGMGGRVARKEGIVDIDNKHLNSIYYEIPAGHLPHSSKNNRNTFSYLRAHTVFTLRGMCMLAYTCVKQREFGQVRWTTTRNWTCWLSLVLGNSCSPESLGWAGGRERKAVRSCGRVEGRRAYISSHNRHGDVMDVPTAVFFPAIASWLLPPSKSLPHNYR